MVLWDDGLMQAVYDRDGFEVVRDVIPVGDLEPLRDRISDQVGLHAKQLLDEGKVDDLFELSLIHI